MATADSVKAKLQGLIDTANAKTGGSDATVTDAVNTLCEGYGQGGAEMETGTYTVTGKSGCNIQTNLSNISAFLIWAETPSGEYYYTLNSHTIYAAVLGLMPLVGSTRRIMHTTNFADLQFVAYQGGIDGNRISFEPASGAQGGFQPSQIIDDTGTTEPITYHWVAFGGVSIGF